MDDDVAAKLNAEARRSGRPFKVVVNEALRRGLLRQPQRDSDVPFVVRPKALGLRRGLSYDNIEELLDVAEGHIRR